MLEQEQSPKPPEIEQQEIFGQVRELAEESGHQFCLYGEDLKEICRVFEIEVPAEVQELFANEFRTHVSAESILRMDEPIELKSMVTNQIRFLYEDQMRGDIE